MAKTLVEIATQPDESALYPIYYIENPVRQPWSETIATLADALGRLRTVTHIIPLEEWVQRVRDWPRREDNGPDGVNPGFLLVDFLEDNFTRMSCGGLLLGTSRAREHSPSLASLGPVSDGLINLYIQRWKDVGFLE